MISFLDFSQKDLWIAAASIAFNPIFWNFVARKEYNDKILTRLAGGNPVRGCYVLAVTIFTIGIIRDRLYEKALRSQPTLSCLDTALFKVLAAFLFASGNVLVVSSMWTLGVTGTYLGDYFGILMEKRVTGFPFNITNNPMYYGSFMAFLGSAIWLAKPSGVFLSLEVLMGYIAALRYEEPFTAEIYAKRDRKRVGKTE